MSDHPVNEPAQRTASGLRVAVIGAGWAGLAAAVHACRLGHQVTVFEASRTPGGRARRVELPLPDGGKLEVDNGQHILIGAYTDTLGLMRAVGATPERLLRRMPLTLRYPDGRGLTLPRLPRPLDAAVGILGFRGWRLGERLALLRAATAWRRAGFTCAPALTVAQLCQPLPTAVQRDFIEPLCVAALNTPTTGASALVFLRVLHDALLGLPGSADLLLPCADLGALWPEPALRWLRTHGAEMQLGARARQLEARAGHWQVDGQNFDRVLLATSASAAARLITDSVAAASPTEHQSATYARVLQQWADQAAALPHQAIATVYALAPASVRPWPAPMLALRSDGTQAPAQFVFDRSALLPPAAPHHAGQRLLAFVVSAAQGEAAQLESGVIAQAKDQLGLVVTPLNTLIEKRATFSCTPNVQRPLMHLAPGLLACGDYIDGPYPATLEGAMRSGLQAANALR